MRTSSTAILLLLTAVSLLFIQPANAVVRRDDLTDTDYLNLGASSDFAAVGKISGTRPTGAGYIASGTLISSQWVLCAGHSLVDGLTPTTFLLGSTNYTIDSFVAHPNFTTESDAYTIGYDVGLVHLSTPVTGVTPAYYYGGTLEKGKTVTYVGYGRTGTGTTGEVTNVGGSKKRGGTNAVDFAGNDTTFLGSNSTPVFGVMYSDFDDGTNTNNSLKTLYGSTSTQTPYESALGSGDSGGASFVFSDGVYQVAGVNSFVSNGNGTYGTVNGSARVSAYSSFIFSKTGVSAFSAIVVPECNTILLLGAGATLVGTVLYRRSPRR